MKIIDLTATEPHEGELWAEILGELVVIRRFESRPELPDPCCIDNLPTQNDLWKAKRNKIAMRRQK